jgi:hypothetical protein
MMKNRAPEPAPWTGPIQLDLFDDDGWDAGSLEVLVHRDDLHVRGEKRLLAVIGRHRFHAWLEEAPQVPYVADDTEWTVTGGGTTLRIDEVCYLVGRHSLDNLRIVLTRRVTNRPAPAGDDSMRPAGVGPYRQPA